MGKGKAEGCASCAKWCLIIFNVLFCLIAVGMIAAGAYAYATLSKYLDFFGNEKVNAPAIVLIVFGAITFLIAALGCIGACKESACVLFTFAAIIGVLLVAEVAAGIAAYLLKDDIDMAVKEQGPKLLAQYNSSEGVKETWDFVQEKLKCCGVEGASDYGNYSIPIPTSCPATAPDGGKTPGCVPAIIDLANDNIYAVAGVGIGLGLLQFLGIVLACCVGCSAKRGEYA